jgi:DNA transposition AAA+ family ATPase
MKKTAAAAATNVTGLANVALALKLCHDLVNRPQNLPGLGVMSGFSGLGKSMAMSVVANKHRAAHVAVKSFDTKKSLLQAIAHELGIQPGGRITIPDLVTEIADELVRSERPLILDDAHHLVNRNSIELVKDIYETSFAPILLVAEERFPKQLRKWEQVHNRVLYWVQAELCSISDAHKLAKLYAPGNSFADDWLGKCLDQVQHITRRVCTNIENARKVAAEEGHRGEITLKWWGDRGFITGQAPQARTL